MAVSPQDIQDKEFREAFRGYNEDDVDTFLDEIAVEFARLYQENQRMKVQLAALQQEIARGGQGAVPAAPSPPSAQAREDEARMEAARKASEAAMEEAKRRAAELVQRAEQRAREIDDLTARRAKDVDADASHALTDAQQRVADLRRQEAEIRKRIRSFLEQQLTSLEPVDLESSSATPRGPIVERMARELGTEEAAAAPQGAGAGGTGEGFWKAE
ncbi:MAG: DivIVA domain-containing protein [Actinomycetota bacterium]